MFSILDILKKHQETRKKEETKKIKADSSVSPLKEKELQLGRINELITPEQGLGISSDISISSAINKEAIEENIRLIAELYGQLFGFAKKFYAADAGDYSETKKELTGLMEREVDLLSVGTKESLKSALSDYANPADFLYYNVTNVSFMAVEIGIGLDYDRAHLVELGMAAFLHDIGTVKYLDIVNKPERLSQQDYNKVKLHTQAGIDFLNKWFNDAPNSFFEVISCEHERMDGSGYPRGVKGADISEFAQIVGLVDVYEAMLHQRPYRDKFTPTQTINTILNNKNAFSYKITKVLIERIGIFPVGYRVRLNTKEIGVVVKDNPKSPLRPVVSIMFDLSGRQLTSPKEIDLAKNPVIYIEECLDCVKKEP